MNFVNIFFDFIAFLIYFSIDKIKEIVYYIHVRRSRKADKEGGRTVNEMTSQELNQYLENIAKLIEATAKDAEEAAKIVRDSKVKA